VVKTLQTRVGIAPPRTTRCGPSFPKAGAASLRGQDETLTHKFAEMTPEKRPQDPDMNGTGLRSETREHGGEYSDTMPQAIKLIDAEGPLLHLCADHTGRQAGRQPRICARCGGRLRAPPVWAAPRASSAPAAPNERTHGPLSRSGAPRLARFDARNDFLQVTNDPLHVGADRK
jgi:hypothetical protein